MGVQRDLLPAILGAAFITTLTIAGGAQREVDTGRASFISDRFHGEETASGETFDNEELVAAHRSYPPGTKLRVTNLENDKSVNVRVVDHGPAEDTSQTGVIIDLSQAAARQLEFTEEGHAEVRIERLADPD